MSSITRRSALFGTAAAAATLAAVAPGLEAWAAPALGIINPADGLEHVQGKLLVPPAVMAHDQVAKGGPKVVEFKMTIEEKEIIVDNDGTSFQAMTFNGSMPGPTMVVHEGDYLQLTLVNAPTNSLPHNIDFHAATGALGGGALTLISPGEQTTLRFKATKPGTFVYHCAPEGMIPWHVVSGMSGTVMVLPRAGLKDGKGTPIRYDRIYTIGEFDLYIPKDETGNYKSYESPVDSYSDTLEVMRGLVPTHVVFNGKVGSLTGENAMTAKVGETVMFVHSVANRDTRPHLIGGHGDYVWETGGFANAPQVGLETWFVRGGSAGAAIYTFRQPGIYAYVNHNLIEATELGAAAHVKVEGEWDDDLMSQISAPGPIIGL